MKRFVKKASSLLVILTCLTNLISCNQPSVSKYYGTKHLPYQERVNSFVLLSSLQLKEMVADTIGNANASFTVFVYLAGCQSCSTLKQYIEKLASEEHMVFYGIDFTSYNLLYKENPLLFPLCYGTPMLLYYNDGKVNESPLENYTLKSYDDFKTSLHSTYSSERIVSLNDADELTGVDGTKNYIYNSQKFDSYSYLEEKIKNSDKLAVFFTWKRCIDCKLLFSSFLLDYSKTSTQTIYNFEVSYFRDNLPGDNSDVTNEYYLRWKNFGDKFGLTNYQNGKVPSLVLFENGAFSKMVVYLNYGEASQNSDSTYSFKDAYNQEIKDIKASNEEELYNQSLIKNEELIKNLYQSM